MWREDRADSKSGEDVLNGEGCYCAKADVMQLPNAVRPFGLLSQCVDGCGIGTCFVTYVASPTNPHPQQAVYSEYVFENTPLQRLTWLEQTSQADLE